MNFTARDRRPSLPRLSTVIRTVGLSAALVALVTVPFWLDRGSQRLLVEVLTYIALAQLWNLLAGYAGLLSIGQQSFVGLGGYLLFSLAMLAGVPVLVAIPIVGLATALIAIPTALVAFRLSGPYFAIGTWVIAEVFRLGFAQVRVLGGGSGISLPVELVRAIAADRAGRDNVIYWLTLSVTCLVVVGVWALMRSRIGLALSAIRDSEEAAESNGVATMQVKLIVFVVTAGLTGLIGALVFLRNLRISPEAAFSVNDWTVLVLFMVIIGGIGSIEGPIIGCIVFFVLRETFADLGTSYMVGLGLLSLLVILVAPQGLWGLVTARTGFRVFPITRASGLTAASEAPIAGKGDPAGGESAKS